MTRVPSPEVQVERAMVALRRRQSRRAIARSAGIDPAGPDALTVQVLDAIAAAPDPTVSAVADLLAVDHPRASRLVSRAVAAGLAERRSDQADGRRSLLTLTTAGRRTLASVQRTRRAAMARAMREWTERERREFAALLVRFVDGLDA